jgi:hypothetical protein
MQVIYTLFDTPHPDHDFEAALRCTKQFAGVPVKVISKYPEKLAWEPWSVLGEAIPDRMWRTSLLRWLVIQALPDTEFPVLCLDWDCVVYRDVKSLFEKTRDTDICFTVDDHGNTGQPWIFNRPEPLNCFASMLLTLLRTQAPALRAPSPGNFQDMGFWQQIVNMCQWKTKLINDLVDHNLACACGCGQQACEPEFKDVPKRKKIVYDDGLPCFVSLDGPLVKPYFIHFWGPLKPLIGRVAKDIRV